MKHANVVLLVLATGCDQAEDSGLHADTDGHTMDMDTGSDLDITGRSFDELRTAALETGTVVLAGLTLAEATSMDVIVGDPGAYEGNLVQVQGMVATVCSGNGCNADLLDHDGNLIKLQTDEGAEDALDLRDYTSVAQFGIAEGLGTNISDPVTIALQGAVFLATDCAL